MLLPQQKVLHHLTPESPLSMKKQLYFPKWLYLVCLLLFIFILVLAFACTRSDERLSCPLKSFWKWAISCKVTVFVTFFWRISVPCKFEKKIPFFFKEKGAREEGSKAWYEWHPTGTILPPPWLQPRTGEPVPAVAFSAARQPHGNRAGEPHGWSSAALSEVRPGAVSLVVESLLWIHVWPPFQTKWEIWYLRPMPNEPPCPTNRGCPDCLDCHLL